MALGPPQCLPRADFDRKYRTSRSMALTQEALSLGLHSWTLRPNFLNPAIFDAAAAYARSCEKDDLIVRTHGKRGEWIHKSETHHPSCDRRHESLCHRENRLNTYSLRGFCDNPFYWPMNHMDRTTFDLAHHVWLLFLPLLQQMLPADSIALHHMPNLAVILKFVADRGGKNQKPDLVG